MNCPAEKGRTKMDKKKVIEISAEEIGKAVSEFMRVRYDFIAFKVDFKVQTEMSDNAEPTCVGKLVGASVTVL